MKFKITTVFPGKGEVAIAEVDDYQTARMIARSESARTSGRYHLLPNAPMAPVSEWFSNGISEG